MALVVFSGFAELGVPPTTDRKALVDAIESLTTGRGTAIGAAMLKGIDAIAEANPNVPPVGDAPEDGPPPAAAAPGASGYVPDIVVLLTDGASNRGIEPLDAVPYAVERGVRVFTIGFGTENPAARSCTRAQLGGRVFDNRFGGGGGGGGFGGGGFGGGGFRAPRRPTNPPGSRQADRRHLPQRRGRRSAARGLRRSPQGRRNPEATHRDHLAPRSTRRPPRSRSNRGFDALEPVPVARTGFKRPETLCVAPPSADDIAVVPRFMKISRRSRSRSGGDGRSDRRETREPHRTVRFPSVGTRLSAITGANFKIQNGGSKMEARHQPSRPNGIVTKRQQRTGVIVFLALVVCLSSLVFAGSAASANQSSCANQYPGDPGFVATSPGGS